MPAWRLYQPSKTSHYQNWSWRNQPKFGNRVTQQIPSHLNHQFVLAATWLFKIIITSAMLLLLIIVENSRGVLVSKAWMKICWTSKLVEMVSQTLYFSEKCDILQRNWMIFSVVNQLTVRHLGTVLYMANSSFFIEKITHLFLTIRQKISFNSAMRKLQKL